MVKTNCVKKLKKSLNVLSKIAVNTDSFANHTLTLEKIAFQMMTECMAQAAELAKKI